jgi:ubiquinone/menaquinone biosynthesis C-methylase UbiE
VPGSDIPPGAGAGPGGGHVERAARTYGAAADHFHHAALGFWDRFGAATVARLPLAPGDRVLDLCCGSGASAIPAARAVGPSGEVTGVDVAEPLLALARERAAGLPQAGFRSGDATRTGLPDASFDAVICVFGVFFLPDRPAFVAEMWRLVRPGGTLAITTWGPAWMEPASSIFWAAVGEAEPSLFRAWNPWDEITTPEALTALMAQAGVPAPSVEAVPGEHRLAAPGDFWDIVLGTGYRATADALSPALRSQVRDRVLSELRSRGITALTANVVFGTAVKPA